MESRLGSVLQRSPIDPILQVRQVDVVQGGETDGHRRPDLLTSLYLDHQITVGRVPGDHWDSEELSLLPDLPVDDGDGLGIADGPQGRLDYGSRSKGDFLWRTPLIGDGERQLKKVLCAPVEKLDEVQAYGEWNVGGLSWGE